MQIRRIEHEPHAYAPPKGPLGPAGKGGTGAVSARPSAVSSSQTNTETSGSQLATLRERLKTVPGIRSDAVKAAREKLARGDFLTRNAAEQMAATKLHDDYF
jgi:hypothetical protein